MGFVTALLAVALAAGGAFAQKRLTSGSNIGVGKCKLGTEDCYATYNTIQDAVNAAKPGDVIEILDEGAYNEQVTIDGRDNAKWKNVVGGKNGITIRYIPAAGSTARPTITWNDKENTSPKTCREAKTQGDTIGASGNFETNGALRIIRAQQIIIEGLIIDGGGKYTWGYERIWDTSPNCEGRGGCNGSACPLFHGNAAIAIAVSGNVEIRDCELRRAHFGIAVKDRNTGGVFGNPNPADNDYTVPLSGFGKTGNHLIEYNKIHDNDLGIFFESSWDLGSTVRYNLIYSNYMATTPTGPGSDGDKASGAIGFKDNFLSPIAIYNNTFYDNNMNLVGFWQIGFQHLLFNNIFSKPHAYGQPGTASYMAIDHMFPQRMKHCLLSADGAAPSGPPYYSVQFNKFTNPQQQGNNGIQPGAAIAGSQDGGTFPNDANNKWLETAGLFKSTVATNADFLVPDWTNSSVTSFIRNQGWPAGGIINEDGTLADLGAIPYSGKRPCSSPLDQKSRIRISPFSVVRVSGRTAEVVLYVNEEVGSISGMKIKYIRWIAPVPNNKDSFGNGKDGKVITTTSISTPTTTGTIVPGSNRITFTLSKDVTAADEYGFFEIVLEGKDGTNTVVTDVGFLPYRVLEYTLKIEVLRGSTVTTEVTAGEKVTLRVTPMKGSTAYTTTKLDEVEFSLLPDVTTFIWETETKEFITWKDLGPGVGTKNDLFFKKAGETFISGAGVYANKANNTSLVFLGESKLIVKPGPAEKVEFKDPISLTQLGTGSPPVINRGVDKNVLVEVQDKYGNAVDVATPVTIVSDKPDIGDVGAPGAINTKTVNSDKTGIATFIAKVVNGISGNTFDMTASIKDGSTADDDVGRLRIGRALDRLDIFYADTALAAGGKVKFDPTAQINGNVGDWFKVTVRVVVADTINDKQTGKFVVVTSPDPGLIFSATSGGAPSADLKFALTNGVATFWISASKDVKDACLDVESQNSDGNYGGVSPGTRCEINFTKPSSAILNAVVYGDAHGRPDGLLIYFDGSAGGDGFKGMFKDQLPGKVELNWGGTTLTASGSAISVEDEFVLKAVFAGTRPSGYTSISGSGRGLAVVYGGISGADAVDDLFDVLDGIGPVIASTADNIAARVNPTIVENPDPGTEPDVINITVSEPIRDFNSLVGSNSLFYIKGPDAPTNEPGASGGTALTVKEAVLLDGSMYQVVVEPISGGLQPGDWIRFNPAGTVADRAGPPIGAMAADNKPSSDNRWARLDLQEKTPEVREAWYTSNVTTGKPDTAFVVFDKPVNLETWFSDGSVNFGKQDVVNVATVGLASLFTASGNTLKIDLTVAFKTSQSSVRTSDDMAFTLGYASAKKEEWGASVSVQARDKAKPVLADTVFLHIGDLKDDGTTTDTLKVTYSERPGDDALKLDRPVTIQTSGGACQPVMKLFGQVVPAGGSSRFYKATYVIEGDLTQQCPAFPETGNMVKIDAASGFGDDRIPSNTLDPTVDADNLKQPLKVIRELKWTVKVKGNPFKSESAGSSKVGVEISPNAAGVKNVNIDATILVFDNVGALVVDTTLKNIPTKIDWSWNGTNQKGRLVGTGTYLFKAICRAKILNDGGGEEPMPPPPAVVRSLGVVRGN
jgi:hypothetical protein